MSVLRASLACWMIARCWNVSGLLIPTVTKLVSVTVTVFVIVTGAAG